MKRILAASTLAMLASPAAADPVELVCNGELTKYDDNHFHSPINGMHILVGNGTLMISGGNHGEPTTYAIDSEASNAADLFFSSGRWGGRLNRYSGELMLWPEPDTTAATFNGHLSARCGKADPLF